MFSYSNAKCLEISVYVHICMLTWLRQWSVGSMACSHSHYHLFWLWEKLWNPEELFPAKATDVKSNKTSALFFESLLWGWLRVQWLFCSIVGAMYADVWKWIAIYRQMIIMSLFVLNNELTKLEISNVLIYCMISIHLSLSKSWF